MRLVTDFFKNNRILNFARSRDLRTKITILALLTLAPAIGLIIFSAYQQQKVAKTEARDLAGRFIKVARDRHEALIEGTKQVLVMIGQIPSLESQKSSCESILKGLLDSLSPRYVNLGVLNTKGFAVCSAVPISGPVDLSFRTYFKRAVATRAFAGGDLQIGRITGKPSINFALPIYTRSGELRVVPYAALDLDWLQSLAVTAGLPEGSNLRLLDSNGRTVVSYPKKAEVEKESSYLESDTEVFSHDEDGVVRVYSSARLRNGLGDGNLEIVVGVPLNTALLLSNPVLAKDVLILGGAIALTLLLLWFGSHWLVLRPIKEMLKATKRLAAGDFSVRLATTDTKSEFGRLAIEFDRMATNLQERIRELKESEIEIRKAKDLADQANGAKSEFLAHMSHEIRTPLGAILGFTEMLAHEESLQRGSSVQTVLKNAQNLLQIFDEILDVSRIDTGAWQPDANWFPLLPELKLLKETFSKEARDRGLDFQFYFESKIPMLICTDRIRLVQIFNNVISNAVKFTQQGSVVVATRLETVESDVNDKLNGKLNGKLVTTVRDSGKGIDPSELERLFKPFSQGDGARNRRFGGIGLGLVLARKFARKLGGDVRLIESNPGVGSTFEISITCGPRAEFRLIDGPVADADWKSANISIQPPLLRLDNIRILIAEDSADNRVLLERVLKRSGAHIEFAMNGEEAIGKSLALLPDIVLMDIQMPILDGLEATRRLKSSGFDRPIMALTAHAMRGERELCLIAGCDDYESKPVNFSRLILTIRRLVQTHRFSRLSGSLALENSGTDPARSL